MADVFTKARRSAVMARIRGRGNKDTELALMRVFRRHGFSGWRRHPGIFGNPDFIFPKLRLAVFVDGCFWHGCPKHATQPKNNAEFWRKKLAGNRERDRLVSRRLRRAGWRVVRVWEHELGKKQEAKLLGRIRKYFSQKETKLRKELRA